MFQINNYYLRNSVSGFAVERVCDAVLSIAP